MRRLSWKNSNSFGAKVTAPRPEAAAKAVGYLLLRCRRTEVSTFFRDWRCDEARTGKIPRVGTEAGQLARPAGGRRLTMSSARPTPPSPWSNTEATPAPIAGRPRRSARRRGHRSGEGPGGCGRGERASERRADHADLLHQRPPLRRTLDQSAFGDALLGTLGHRVRSAALDFVSWGPSAGVLLLLATVFAVIVANTTLGPAFAASGNSISGFRSAAAASRCRCGSGSMTAC